MAMVRTKEQQAEEIAHLPDDIFRVPRTNMRIGADPLLGLIPVIGDVIATILGAAIMVIAQQLDIPWRLVAYMAFNQLKNGLIGAVPFIGDAYSFYFKSNAVNTALLLRAVKRGEDGACALTTHALTMRDIAGLALMILPTLALAGFVSVWFWDHNISFISLFFPAPYNSRYCGITAGFLERPAIYNESSDELEFGGQLQGLAFRYSEPLSVMRPSHVLEHAPASARCAASIG